MKRLLFFFLVSLPILVFAQNESVDVFHSEILVDTSGYITVKEHIEIYATGQKFKRGIVRNLPLSRKDSLGSSIPVSYEVKQVLKEGEPSPYFTENKGGDLYIYVGEKSTYLEEGRYSYEITYSTAGQIGFFKDFDELYWNVNGFGWDFPIHSIRASVTLPNQSKALSTACYTGMYGSTLQNCDISTGEGKTIFETLNLNPNENLSIALSFEKGLVNQPPPPPPPSFLQEYGAQIMTLIFGLALLAYYAYTWWKYGQDPPKPTVVPQFNPPDNLSPASLGMIHKGHFWQDLSTASLVNLAVKGFIKIEDHSDSYLFGLVKNKEFSISQLKPADSSLAREERELMIQFFQNKEKVVFDGKYDSAIKSALDRFQKKLTDKWNPLLFEGFNAKFWIFPILFSIIYVALFFVWHQYFTGSAKFIYFAVFFFSNILVFLFYQWLIRKPAKEKLRLRSDIKGFEMYLSAAEEKGLQHFNPPHITPEIFEKYLPYALVLGVEDIWGEKFQKMLSASSTYSSAYQPIWYNRPIGNIATFGHMLNSNFSNTLSSSATKPSSSGGGGWSSGSGGGGFSGGGGGGGGGGGW
ncbi:DUF2207 domain-containing protein [Marinilongibacter aquaticus]|uniref:DUF2207 domain-containing protein n=1 Tax=Marinilongibacter aquaticus TaxID=2975157 RepID=UPI0021BD3BFF|nr:DUF2207 domain-containing protein [Marinilongibacter aquaticus]UBM58955.1 DUF2207 domain-containing protein [Marinilongibacter aquaticus]